MSGADRDAGDEAFARLAIAKGYLSLEQVEEGRRIQARMGRLGMAKSLSEVAVYREFVTDLEVKAIRRYRKFLVQSHRDRALAERAVEAGALPHAAAEKGFRLQRDHFARTGKALELLEFLVASSDLDDDTAARIRDLPVDVPPIDAEAFDDLPTIESAPPAETRVVPRAAPLEVPPIGEAPVEEPPPVRRDGAASPAAAVPAGTGERRRRETPGVEAIRSDDPLPARAPEPARLADAGERRRRVLTALFTIAVLGAMTLVGFLVIAARSAIVDSAWREAERSFQAEAYDEAGPLYEAFLREHPTDSRGARARSRLQEIEISRGDVAAREGDPEGAIRIYESAIEIDRDGERALEARGRLATLRQEIARSEAAARVADLARSTRQMALEKGKRPALDFLRRIERTGFPADLLDPLDALERELEEAARSEILASFVWAPAGGPEPDYDGPALDRTTSPGGEVVALPLLDPLPGTPLAGARGVVLAQAKGLLHALDAADGRIRWTLSPGLGRRFPPARFDAPEPGVLVVSGMRNTIARIALETGAVRWERVVPDPVSTGATIHDGKVYAGTLDGRVHAFDLADGRRLGAWQLGAEVLAAPAVEPETGLLYAPAADAHVYAFRLADRSFAGRFEVPHLAPLSPVPFPPWVAVFAVAPGESRVVYARALEKDGEWTFSTDDTFSFEGKIESEPEAAPARLLVATDRGEIGILETSAASGEDGEVYSLTQAGAWLRSDDEGPLFTAWTGTDSFVVAGRVARRYGVARGGEAPFERLPLEGTSPPEASEVLAGRQVEAPRLAGDGLVLTLAPGDGDWVRVVCLDLATLRIAWWRDLGAAAAQGVVATDDGHLLVRTSQGSVHAITPQGESRPHHSIVHREARNWRDVPWFACDAAAGGTVYLEEWPSGTWRRRGGDAGPPPAGALLAVDVVTGWVRETWRPDARLTSHLAGPPAPSGDSLYVATRDGHLLSLDRSTGRETALPFLDEGGFTTGPAAAGDVLCAGTPPGLVRVEVRQGASAGPYLAQAWRAPSEAVLGGPALDGETVWTGAQDRLLRALALSDGRELARLEFPSPVRLAPVLGPGRVYAAAEDGTIAAIDRATRAEVWRRRLPARPGGEPTVDGDRLVLGDRSGVVHVLAAATGEPIRTWTLPAPVTGRIARLGGHYYAPAEDGYVYRIDAP